MLSEKNLWEIWHKFLAGWVAFLSHNQNVKTPTINY